MGDLNFVVLPNIGDTLRGKISTKQSWSSSPTAYQAPCRAKASPIDFQPLLSCVHSRPLLATEFPYFIPPSNIASVGFNKQSQVTNKCSCTLSVVGNARKRNLPIIKTTDVNILVLFRMKSIKHAYATWTLFQLKLSTALDRQSPKGIIQT